MPIHPQPLLNEPKMMNRRGLAVNAIHVTQQNAHAALGALRSAKIQIIQ